MYASRDGGLDNHGSSPCVHHAARAGGRHAYCTDTSLERGLWVTQRVPGRDTSLNPADYGVMTGVQGFGAR